MATLDQLPVDIQYAILSYFLCPLVSLDFPRVPQDIDGLVKTETIAMMKITEKPFSTHPYLVLAAQNRALRLSVEAYCHHLIRKHLPIADVKSIDSSPGHWSVAVAANSDKSETRTYRMQYLRFTFHRCLFCGKKSKRRAVFNSHMWCCLKCDNREFGEKISKSVAHSRYRIKPTQYLYPHIMFPESGFRPLETACAHLAIYKGATMLYIKEVEALSTYIKANDPAGARNKMLNKRVAEKDSLDKYLKSLQHEQQARRALTEVLQQPTSASAEDEVRLRRLLNLGKSHLDRAWWSSDAWKYDVRHRRFLRLCDSLIACSEDPYRQVVPMEDDCNLYWIEASKVPENHNLM